MPAHRRKAYLLLTLVSAIWGFATYVIKITLPAIPPLPFLTYRFALAGLFAFVMLAMAKTHLKKLLANFWTVVIYSALNTTVALGLLFVGLENTSIIDTALLIAVGPLITSVAGVVFLQERVTNRERLGIGLAVFGSLVTIFGPLITTGEQLRFTGNLFVLGYLATAGISSVMSKKLVRKDIDPLALTNFSFIVAFLTTLPLALTQVTLSNLVLSVSHLPLPAHLGVWYMAFISGTLAYALWVKAQKSIEVSEVGVFGYLNAIFAVPFGIWLLGEKLTIPLIMGALLIIIGVIVAETKSKD